MGARAPRSVLVTAAGATVVALAALVAVVLLRAERNSDPADLGSASAGRLDLDAAASCGDQPCEVLTSLPVGESTVELLTDVQGKHGKLRIFGPDGSTVITTALGPMGVRLEQTSLTCAAASTSACLVYGDHRHGYAGQLFVAGDDGWRAVEESYFSEGRYLEVAQVTGDDEPELLVANCARECSAGAVVLEVFTLDGELAGCTDEYGGLRQLPGWPDVVLSDVDLHSC